MRPIVYLGSTLSCSEALRLAPELDYRPPVRQGQVYQAALEGARVICIIDGELDQALPVWHKEILWALARGARVIGAASMGALRAVELEPFGMTGVGQVYQWFRDGVLEDDDEVVIAHAPRELGFRPLSEAMVNIRASVARAVERGLLDRESARDLLERAKALHYTARSYGALRQETAGLPGMSRFWAELPALSVDVKAQDARQALEHTRAAIDEPAPSFELAPSSAWAVFVQHYGPGRAERSRPEGDARQLTAYHRALALALAHASGLALEASEVQASSEAFRRRRGLLDPAATRAWLESLQLSLEDFSRLMHDELAIRTASGLARERALAQLAILDWLGEGSGDGGGA